MTDEPQGTSLDALLMGSRGRRLCLAYAMAVGPAIRQKVFWLGVRAASTGSTPLTIGAPAVSSEAPPVTAADLVTELDSLEVVHPDEDAPHRAGTTGSEPPVATDAG